MTPDITLVSVFGAGVISFLSPCVLPLLPAYLTYMAGVSIGEINSVNNSKTQIAKIRRKIITNAIAFVGGFCVVFVALGAGASVIGGMVRQYQDTLAVIAGIVIIIMGLHFLGITKIEILNREWRVGNKTTQNKMKNMGVGASFVMGLAFAFGWTPCIGPVLGVVLGVAASQETLGQGAGLLALYGAGLGVPFIIAAVFTQPVMQWIGAVRHRLYVVEKIMGGMLIFAGVMFLTGGMQDFAYFLLETFPNLQNFG